MNRFTLFTLFAVSSLFISCSTTKEYGSRHTRFSSQRLAALEHHAPKGETVRSRSSRNRTAVVKADTPADSRSSSPVSVKKARYHAERNNIIREANKHVGVPYVYGGKSPESGFDCSGFVAHVFKKEGILLNGSAQAISRMAAHKPLDQLNPGDLIFFGKKGDITHVGIVTINDGKNLSMIHSASSVGITSDNITHSDYWRGKALFGMDLLSAHFERDLGFK